MEIRYQERRSSPLPSGGSRGQHDSNIVFPALALPFEARYQETAWKLSEPQMLQRVMWQVDITLLGLRGGDRLQQREFLLSLPRELHFTGTGFCWKAVSCSDSDGFGPPLLQVRFVSVQSVGACILGQAGDRLGKWKICMFLRRLTASRAQAVIATELCPKPQAKTREWCFEDPEMLHIKAQARA